MSDENTTEETRNGGPTLTHSQSVKRLEEIYARMEELGEADDLTPDEDDEFSGLRSEFTEVDEHRKRLERAAELAAVRTAAAGVKSSRKLRTEAGSSQASRSDYDRDAIMEPDSIEDCRFRNPWDLSEVRTYGRDSGEVNTEMRARALSAIEKLRGTSDDIRQAATTIIEQHDEGGKLARQCLLTSSPAYTRAWSKMAVNPHGAMLTTDEQRALEAVRAMSLTDANGGYLVPFQLDPTVIITSSGSRNDIRQFARTVVATGDVWHGVSAGAVSWSWDAEASEVSDDAPTFAQPTVDIFKAAGFVPISLEALQDEANVTAEVGKLLAFGKDELEASAFITGNGTTQPKGIVTALDGTAAEKSPATAETFALADVYATYDAVPARYRGMGSWLANNLIYSKIRQLDVYGGGGLWETVGNDRPSQLLGRPIGEAEAMDGVWSTTATADNFILLFGDLSNYVIADRIGMSVEFIPHLFHTTSNRPSGQRGWYAHYRVGANVVGSASAFALLNLATTS